MIHLDEIKKLMPYLTTARAEGFLDPLNAAMAEFDITTPLREAAFLAQVAVESGELKYVRELASGAAYEGRAELGNTHAGDGAKFRGRGLLQITGRDGYARCGDALGLDLVLAPELLEDPVNACRSAAWYWKRHGLNELADQENFLLITKRINGGTTGYPARQTYYEHAKSILQGDTA